MKSRLVCQRYASMSLALIVYLCTPSGVASQVPVKTLQIVRAIPANRLQTVREMAFSDKGDLLAIVQDGITEFYSTETEKLVEFEKFTNSRSIAFMKADELAVLDGSHLMVWNRRDANIKLVSPTGPDWAKVYFTPVTGNRAGTIAVAAWHDGEGNSFVGKWDLAGNRGPTPFHIPVKDELIKTIDVTRDGTKAVGGSFFGDVYLWEIQTGRLLKQLRVGTGRRGAMPTVLATTDTVRYVKISDSADQVRVAALVSGYVNGKARFLAMIYEQMKPANFEAWNAREVAASVDDGSTAAWESMDMCVSQPFLAVSGSSNNGKLIDIRSGAIIGKFELTNELRKKHGLRGDDEGEREVRERRYQPLKLAADGSRLASIDNLGNVVIWKIAR